MARSRRAPVKASARATAPVAAVFAPAPPPEPTSPFVQETPESADAGLNKARLIREYLQEVGLHNSSISGLREWLRSRLPGASFGDAALRTALSQQRKKLAGSESAIIYKGKITNSTRVPLRLNPDELSYGNLATVKEKAEEFEGGFDLDALSERVEKVAELVMAVGGIENLLKAIQALRNLRS